MEGKKSTLVFSRPLILLLQIEQCEHKYKFDVMLIDIILNMTVVPRDSS